MEPSHDFCIGLLAIVVAWIDMRQSIAHGGFPVHLLCVCVVLGLQIVYTGTRLWV
jgi:hypothetical protein